MKFKFLIFFRKKVEKIEDLNHFSKRMKRGLETVKRDYGRKKLSDGKTIGGRNHLSGEYLGLRRYYYKKIEIFYFLFQLRIYSGFK